jgi:hypothetical protein
MPVDISVQGANELAVIVRRLKEIGDKDLRKELYAGINRATKPLKQDVKEAAARDLPQRGGLASVIASSKLTTAKRGGGRNPGVRITGKLAGHDLSSIDRGRLRHPVFGNKNVWVNQTVAAGFFSKTIEAGAPKVRAELLDVLESVARRLVDG